MVGRRRSSMRRSSFIIWAKLRSFGPDDESFRISMRSDMGARAKRDDRPRPERSGAEAIGRALPLRGDPRPAIAADLEYTYTSSTFSSQEANETHNLKRTNRQISSNRVRYTAPLIKFSFTQPRTDPSHLLRCSSKIVLRL